MTKKAISILILVLAVALMMSGCKVIELQQEPKDENEVVAEFKGGTILLGAAEKEYQDIVALYQANGYGELLEDDAMVSELKKDTLDYMVRDAIFAAKATEFGIGEIPEEKRVELVKGAIDEFNQLIEMYMPSFREEGQTDEEALATTRLALEQYMGVNEQIMQNYALLDYKEEMMFDYVTKDITLTEEAQKKAYDEAVEADKLAYGEDISAFENAIMYSDMVAWYPEGFRTVKHLLLKTPEDLEEQMYDLEDRLALVETEIEDRNNPEAEEDVAVDADAEGDAPDSVNDEALPVDAAAEEIAAEEGAVQGATVDSPEAIDQGVTVDSADAVDQDASAGSDEAIDQEAIEAMLGDLGGDEFDVELVSVEDEIVGDEEESDAGFEEEDFSALSMEELEALKSEIGQQIADLQTKIKDALEVRATEIQAKIDAGEDFNQLIAEYGEDPGMQSEPTMSTGYYVSAQSTMWDPAFAEGAMALEKVGDISGPVYGQNGIHFIRYETDVTPGAVPYESLKDLLSETALESLKTEEYEKVTEGWITDADVKLYPEKL